MPTKGPDRAEGPKRLIKLRLSGTRWPMPRGGPVRQRFERHARAWPLRRLSDALQAILKAEQDRKSTGYPDEAIARRICLALASSARAASAALKRIVALSCRRK